MRCVFATASLLLLSLLGAAWIVFERDDVKSSPMLAERLPRSEKDLTLPDEEHATRRILSSPSCEEAEEGPHLWTLRGQVLDAVTGAPVTACRLTWTSIEGDASGSRLTRDAQGRFDVALPSAGPWRLRVSDADLHEEMTSEAVKLPRPDLLRMVLAPVSVIQGTVRDETGAMVPGVSVALRVMKLAPGRRLPRWTLAVTDRAGHYRFARPAPGSYALRASYHEAPLAETEPFEITERAHVVRDITVETPRVLNVTVRDRLGEPLSRARVSLRPAGKDATAVRTGRTDDEGIVSLRYLPAGRHILRVALGGYAVHEEPFVMNTGDRQREITCWLSHTSPP